MTANHRSPAWTEVAMLNQLLRGAVAVAILAIVLPANLVGAQTTGTRVTIFHDTHLHGNLWTPDGLTLTNYVGLINQLRSGLPTPANSLFLGNGDDIASSVSSAVFRGQHIVDALNAARLDANTFGNHDFDLGPDRLREMIAASRFAWVSANARDVRTGDVFGQTDGARQFIVKEVGGVRFGITGLAPGDTPTVSSPGPNVRFVDPAEAMRDVLPKMRAAGAQVTVVLSHLCADDLEKVAAAVTGIDVAVGDHCATALRQPKVVNGTIVSRRGDELKLLGQLDLTIQAGKIVSHAYLQHTVTKDTPDAAVGAIVDRYRAELDRALAAPAGTLDTQLIVNRDVMRTGEAAAGNLVADALRARAQSDVALVNGGGVRGETTFGPGVLKKADVVTMLPFPNYLTVLRLTGAQLKEALENGVSDIANKGGRFPQVSGMAFRFDSNAAVGARVGAVTVGGRPLDLTARYTVATVDFLAGGGDGYRVLGAAEIVLPAASGPLISNVVTDYLVAQGSVRPRVEGRIAIGAATPVQLPRTGGPTVPVEMVVGGAFLLGLGGWTLRRRARPNVTPD
jgi:2',3'-cyclic-nucleotide 2'-phosphodiesterase/3'-nucleotidase